MTLLKCFAAVVTEVQPFIYLGEAILPLVILLLADWGIGSKVPLEQLLMRKVLMTIRTLLLAAVDGQN